MPIYKNYRNEQLEQKVIQIIPQYKYNEFSSIVIDALLRRAYEFNLPEEQILEDAKKFEKNVSSISFAYGKEVKKAKWAGLTCYDGRILINGEYYKKLLSKCTNEQKHYVLLNMYETIIHEIFHGIAINITGTALETNMFYRRN